MTVRTYVLSARLLALWGILKLCLKAKRTLPKFLWRRWYDDLSELTDSIFGELPFMNYGFAGAEVPLERADEPHRYQIQLYHEVATAGGRRQLRGARVLEVGCGRGGGASYVARCLGPAAVDAIDLSKTAIASCLQQHTGISQLRFHEGDAERLPFPDAAFDVVLNVETSHCYPDFPRFLTEVARVLAPGGTLRLADFRRPEHVDAWLAAMDVSTLNRVETRELTEGVAAALDLDDARKRRAIQYSAAPAFVKNALRQFTGCRGSTIHDNFASRRRVYLEVVLEKG